MKRRLALLLLAVVPLLAQQAPPPPGPPKEGRVPQPVEQTLSNGLRVIVVPDHDIPLVSARLLVKAGAAADPKGRDGLAQFTATLITKGTKTRSAEQIARGVEALGATLNTTAGWDSTMIDLSVMSNNLAQAMAYVADVARNPTFANEEIERERAQAIDSLSVSLQQPDVIASLVASRLVFGDAPYAHNLEGLPSTLEKIKRADLAAFHRAHYRPENAVLILAGDVKGESAFNIAKEQFGAWKRGTASSTAAAAAETKFPKPRIVVVDMPEAGQTAVVVARPGIKRTDPAFMQAAVTNAVLGGGYSSRLNQEIRIRRGLSYGAGSSFEPRLHVGPFIASTETKHESAAEVAGIFVSELDRLSSEDVQESELTPRKAALIGDFAFSLETNSGIVHRVGTLARYGLPLSDINKFVSNVQAVTAQDVRRFSTANLRTSEASVVFAGDAKAFAEPLRAQFKDAEVEVIPLAELDLSSPTLRVRKAKE
jgi:zinc protease